MTALTNLDDILPKEFVQHRKRTYELRQLKKKKDVYWDFLGELMFFGGFEAVKAVLDDYIEIEQAKKLLDSSKKSYYGSIYDHGMAALAGASGARKPSAFSKLMKFYEREME